MKSPAPLLEVETNLDPATTTRMTVSERHMSKLFDIIANSVYTDKVLACIRESWSNAFDSHVAAGKENVPFDTILPTEDLPTFVVRDYGVSMTHDTVLGLYSRAFDSSKDNDNTATGRLGIGKLAPLAIADSFVLTRFNQGWARGYVIARGADSIPGITPLGDQDYPTTEPDGIEIQVPVALDLIDEFPRKAEQLTFGYDVPPVPRPEYDTPLSGDNWQVVTYPLPAKIMVRQGSVVYPVPVSELQDIAGVPNLRSTGASLIVDIPLGSADVGPDRESLSFDPNTKANVRKFVAEALEETMEAVFEILQQSHNWIDRCRLVHSLSGWYEVDDIDRYNYLYLSGGSDWDPPTFSADTKKYGRQLRLSFTAVSGHPLSPSNARRSGKKTLRANPLELKRSKFVINRPGVVRGTKRITNYLSHHPRYGGTSVYVVEDPTPRQLERMVTLWGLTPGQIVPVASLPDCPPEPRYREPKAPGQSRNKAGIYRVQRNLVSGIASIPDDYLWVSTDSRNLSQSVTLPLPILSYGGTDTTLGSLATHVQGSLQAFQCDWPILAFLPTAKKRIKPNPSRELSFWITEQVNLARHKLPEIYEDIAKDADADDLHRRLLETLLGEEVDTYTTFLRTKKTNRHPVLRRAIQHNWALIYLFTGRQLDLSRQAPVLRLRGNRVERITAKFPLVFRSDPIHSREARKEHAEAALQQLTEYVSFTRSNHHNKETTP